MSTTNLVWQHSWRHCNKKVPENRNSIKRCIPWGPSQASGAYSSGIPNPGRTIPVSDAPREWPEWEWLMYKSILLRLGEGSACWVLLKLSHENNLIVPYHLKRQSHPFLGPLPSLHSRDHNSFLMSWSFRPIRTDLTHLIIARYCEKEAVGLGTRRKPHPFRDSVAPRLF